jgi:predicted nucleic acid-binding protein
VTDNPSTLLIDTDVFSYLWRGGPEAERFRPVVQGATLALSFTSVGELWYGATKRNWGDKKRDALQAAMRPYVVLPYTRELARQWGGLRAGLERTGQSLADNDLWIAATALHYAIPLVTNNRRHFERVPDISLLPSERIAHDPDS